MLQRPLHSRQPGHRQALATLVALSALVLPSCTTQSDDDTATAPAVVTEAQAPPEADPAPVYDVPTFLTLHKTREQLADAVNHLSLHVPSTKETNGICNENLLQRLGPSGHIVNTSRGALIDQKALLDSLNGQGTRWASLDVFQSEPPVDDVSKDLMLHPRVTATPHVAYLSSQSTERLRRLAGAKLRSLLDESAST